MIHKRRRLLVTAAMLMAGAALAALGCGVQGYGWAIASPTPPFDPWEEDIYGPGGATALYVGPSLTTIAPTPTLTGQQRRVYDLLNLSVDFRESRPDLSYLLAVEAVKAAQRNAQADLIARAQTALYEMLTPAGSYVVLRGHTGAFTSASFSADGSRILTTGQDGVARLWTVEGQLLAALDLQTRRLTFAQLSPDGTRVITQTDDQEVDLWTADGQHIATLVDHGVSFAGFSPHGTKILAASDNMIRLWTADGQPAATIVSPVGADMLVRFSPDGTKILVANDQHIPEVLSADGRSSATLETRFDYVHSAGFSPDGTKILIVGYASDNGDRVQVWTASGQPIAALLSDLGGHFVFAGFSPDGKKILTVDGEGLVQLWGTDGRSLATLDTLVLTDSPVPSASLNRDGSRILTVHGDGLRLWDAAAAPIAALKLEGYQDSGITNAAFSPDGTKVFVASRSAVDLWTADGEFITALDGYRAHVRIAAISPDGARILTAGRDGAARLWPVPASVNEMLAEAERRAGRSLTKAECRQYLNQACP